MLGKNVFWANPEQNNVMPCRVITQQIATSGYVVNSVEFAGKKEPEVYNGIYSVYLHTTKAEAQAFLKKAIEVRNKKVEIAAKANKEIADLDKAINGVPEFKGL